ncbi:MAG: hypothetical protein AB1726_13015, partial [Planctomycetota bacterium]
MEPLRTVRRVSLGAALVAFAAGAVAAAIDVLGRRWVLEFQAGPPSPLSARVLAIAQTAALEGVGFGVLAFLLGSLAAGLARAIPRPAAVAQGERFAAGFLAAAAAFAGWAANAWLVDDALPFLAPSELALLNGAGFAALLLGFLAFTWLASRWPAASRGTPAAGALAAAIALGAANALALAVVRSGEGGLRSPGRLAAAAGLVAAALPATALLTPLLAAA